MFDILLAIINTGGGIAGFASVGYLLWRKFKKDIKLFIVSGNYETEKSNDTTSEKIISTAHIGFLNNSDEPVSITDIVGILKYDKKEYEKYATSSQTELIDKEPSRSERPVNFKEVLNFSIRPHESIIKEITFHFSNIIPRMVDRVGIAHFMGFINGKIPFAIIDEREKYKDWENSPLNMLLLVHINGKKLIRNNVPLFKKEFIPENVSGSLSFVDVAKIQKDIWEKQS